MAYLPIYLLTRFVYRLQEFLEHWYVGGFKVISHKAVAFLEELDRTFALQITLRYIFEPLYQDRTVLGYILGFIFRSGRIILAFIIYLIVITFFAAAFLAWALFLPYIIYRTASAFNLITNVSLWNR